MSRLRKKAKSVKCNYLFNVLNTPSLPIKIHYYNVVFIVLLLVEISMWILYELFWGFILIVIIGKTAIFGKNVGANFSFGGEFVSTV
jgi:hypothetical protein